MVFEEETFMLKGSTDSLVAVDVSLTTVDHWNIAKTQRDDSASKDIHNVCSLVPESDNAESDSGD